MIKRPPTPSHIRLSSKPTKNSQNEKLLLNSQKTPSSYCRDISTKNPAKSRGKWGTTISTPSEDVSLALIMAMLEGEITGEQRVVAVCKLLRRDQRPLDSSVHIYCGGFSSKVIFIPIMAVANEPHKAGSHKKFCRNPSMSWTNSPCEETTSPHPTLSQKSRLPLTSLMSTTDDNNNIASPTPSLKTLPQWRRFSSLSPVGFYHHNQEQKIAPHHTE